jgi:FAD/FMN-containing dehydrogenase
MCAPAEDVVFGVTMLRTVSTDTLEDVLAVNRELYERARDLGGKRMTWGAIPFASSDWATHYGPELWSRLQHAKKQFDKRNVLTPGPGIFSTRAGA